MRESEWVGGEIELQGGARARVKRIEIGGKEFYQTVYTYLPPMEWSEPETYRERMRRETIEARERELNGGEE